MPILNLRVAPLQNPENYRALAQAFTQLASDVLHQDPGEVSMLIDDLPAARWYVAGHAVNRPVAQLEVVIVAGSSTDAAKASFIQAAYIALQEHLARSETLETVSHVVVREIPAADWGRCGRSAQPGRVSPAYRIALND